jgi:putative aminopeptidase FrvX
MWFELLKTLSELDGIPTNEKEVTKFITSTLKDHANEVKFDSLGSLIVRKGTKGPKVMISAHVDEVGFMVTSMTEDGFVKFQPIGVSFAQSMLGGLFNIHTSKGVLKAVMGSKPLPLIPLSDRSKALEYKDMFLDLGVSSKKELIDLGVEVGNMITPTSELRELNIHTYMGKALDNRVGVLILMKVFELAKIKDIELYAAFTTQQEVGVKGAKTTSYMVQPDLAISLDASVASDTPGSDKDGNALGKGPQIFIYDPGLIGHHGLRNYIKDIANKSNIHYQETSTHVSTTDGAMLHVSGSGAATIHMGIPVRYVKTHFNLVNKHDIEKTIELLIKVVESLNEKNISEIISA